MNKRRKSGKSTNERKGRGGNHSKKGPAKKTLLEVEGVLRMGRDGSAFLMAEGREDDIYIRSSKTRGALNGDTVKVAVKKKATAPGKHAEGEVIAVLERSTKPFIGVLHIVGNQAWVLMQSKFMPYDISIEVKDKDDRSVIGSLRHTGSNEFTVTGVYETVDGKKRELTAHLGMKVAAVVDEWPRGASNPIGHLVDVLGELGENDTEMHAILAEYGLPYRFEPEVENAADKISEEITAEDLKARKDFRNTLTFTIDPADAKDFDDALSFKKLDNGNYEVGVHIADVSHYVTPGTPVDKEAQSRGTSVYLVDRTVPMLPEKLCNKLCSLRPNEEKLTFSAVFEISPSGKIFNQWIGRTVINSDHRFNYDEAQDVIEGKESPVSQELKDAINTLWDLASIFRKRRFAAGAISFERPEMKVDVDENGKPIGVHQHISKEANWLIEEFMLLANRSVAEFIATCGKMDGKARKNAKTFVYRIHDEPNLEKLQGLRRFAGNFGYKTTVGEGGGDQIARDLNGLLGEAKDKPEFMALEMIALRSMAKACYSTDNIGHYGLAFRFYTHFTSPIRRYPDTMVHRLLAMYLAGADSQNKDYYEQQCVHASEREVIAANAERDSIKYKLVEFMQDKIDQEFDGNISGLTDWGMYVEIDPTKIEGMVPLRDIKSDFFEFDEDNYCLRGRRTRKVYRLGDPVRIRVKATNLEQRLLDYELIESEIENVPAPDSRKKRSSDKRSSDKRSSTKKPAKTSKPSKTRKSR